MKERFAYVRKRTRDWINKVRAEKATGEFQNKDRRNNKGKSSRMAIETTSNERTQQLDTGAQDQDEDLNQPDKF